MFTTVAYFTVANLRQHYQGMSKKPAPPKSTKATKPANVVDSQNRVSMGFDNPKDVCFSFKLLN